MRHIATISLLVVSLSVRAQPAALDVESALERVTVFLNGAQVQRTAAVRLPAGRSTVRFVKLDPELNPQSIQLNAPGMTVLSVTHSINYLDPAPATAEATQLREQIEAGNDSIALEQSMVEVYEREESMLVANQSIGGTAAGVDPVLLEVAANFFRQRMTEVKQARLAHLKRIDALKEEVQKLEQQLQRLAGDLQPVPSSEISVLVDRSAAGTSAFELRYVTRRASWQPLYDVRVADTAHPLALHYRAAVRQWTPEDWENMRLTLSTADPNRRGVRPQIAPQYARYFEDLALIRQTRDRHVALDEVVVTAEAPKNAPVEAGAAGYLTVETRSNTTSTEFEIQEPSTIAANADPSVVDIAQHQVDAAYEYYTAPALSPAAYLTARITDWEALELVSGSANLFFNDTFVGRTYLDMDTVSDTLDLSLGPDPEIVVRRRRVEEFSKRQFLGGRRTDTAAFEIELRNTKSVPVTIVVEDQIPLSSDSGIQVSLEDAGGATHTESTGILRWEKTIPPAATETLHFAYTIRYPRDRRIVIR